MVILLKKMLKKIYFVTLLLRVSLESGLKESFLRHYTFFYLHLKDRLIHVQDVVNVFPRNYVRLEQCCIFSYVSSF
jgi:hypothetical protein